MGKHNIQSEAYSIVTNSMYKHFGLFQSRSGQVFIVYKDKATRLNGGQISELGLTKNAMEKNMVASSTKNMFLVDPLTKKITEVQGKSPESWLDCSDVNVVTDKYGTFHMSADGCKQGGTILFKTNQFDILESSGNLVIETNLNDTQIDELIVYMGN